ncbi:Prim-pol domain family, partial [Trichomonas vaginalis G3]|uniref:Prim-pol domain family n=1 Tax=Trichomonas vaginalis (strain ATCC PRA-98 / G3) TaxID=412133 RepID=UPI0021E5CF81
MTATNNNNYIVSDEQVIDSLAEELVVTETKTLNERIGENKIDLHNYLKHDGGRGRKTGTALLVNKISNLTIIDVDINKSYNDELKETVRKDILSKLSDKDVIVKTASGGLHIYCNTNFFYAVSNRMIKCYSCNDYDIDIMTSIDDSKRSLVVMADSRVRKNASEPINTYSFIRGSYDSTLTRT